MQDNLKLEKHFQLHEIKPVKRFPYKDKEVFIGEGGPFFTNPSEYPLGFYESAYAIGHGEKLLYYQAITFDYMHDIKELTENARKQGRINAAIKTAKDVIDGKGYVVK